jgi:uncharacterized membrane protein
MRSKARIKNHPIHPMLIALPLGLWSFSFIADVLYLLGAGNEWRVVSGYAMAGGIVGALAAAVPGFIDYFALNDSRAKQIATWHMGLNLAAVALYSFNFYIRLNHDFQIALAPFLLSVLTIGFLTVSGWLGGELIYVHRVAVMEE